MAHLDNYLARILRGQDHLSRGLVRLHQHLNYLGVRIMATMQQVQDDLDQIKTQAGNYIAARDAIDVQLRADLAAALANAGTSADEQVAIDKAFQTAEEAKALLTPPVPPPVEPPVDPNAPPVDPNAPPAGAAQPGSPFGRSRP